MGTDPQARLGDTVNEDWKARAACRDVSTSVMFPAPDDKQSLKAALVTCTGCPVRIDCLRHALLNDEAHGVWGGTTARQRFRLARRWRAGTRLEEVIRLALR